MTSVTKYRPSIVVPPSGFAGNAQQTGATQLLFAKASGSRGGLTTQRRRRKAKAAKPRTRKTAKRAKRAGKKARLVKGSAAAKRYMASIRRKRK
jgi:hypothetical protein